MFLFGARVASKVSTRHTKNCAPEFLILSAIKLPSYGLVVFINMNIYIHKEGTNFKTFLKESNPTGLDSCNIFAKKNVEHGIKDDERLN